MNACGNANKSVHRHSHLRSDTCNCKLYNITYTCLAEVLSREDGFRGDYPQLRAMERLACLSHQALCEVCML